MINTNKNLNMLTVKKISFSKKSPLFNKGVNVTSTNYAKSQNTGNLLNKILIPAYKQFYSNSSEIYIIWKDLRSNDYFMSMQNSDKKQLLVKDRCFFKCSATYGRNNDEKLHFRRNDVTKNTGTEIKEFKIVELSN